MFAVQNSLLLLFFSLCVHGVTVDIEEGTVIGHREKYGNKYVDKFLGIPFAEPPVGDLRFSPPKPRRAFSEPFLANHFGHSCIQTTEFLNKTEHTAEPLDFTFSEDCLSLNVYVPGGVEDAKEKPVMVWIYGGGFGKGTSHIYDLRPLVTIGDVIGVSVNYRVGAFGFFSTGDEVAPGNYGLLDQQLALKWVQRNIRAFGGDPSLVTVFGESAGGASVTMHALLSSNSGLFKRLIAQSGSILALWGSDNNNTVPVSREIAISLGCEYDVSHRMVQCMRQVPADDLRKATPVWPTSEDVGVPLTPRVDGSFVSVNPWSTVTGYDRETFDIFRSYDLLMGINSEEGTPLLRLNMHGYFEAQNRSLKDGLSRKDLRVLMQRLAREWDDDLVESALWWMYSKSGDHLTVEEAEEFLGDAAFLYSSVLFVQNHAKKSEGAETDGNTSFYHFFPKPSRAAYVGREKRYDSKDPWQWGAGHADELYYLFSTPGHPDAREKGVPQEEIRLAHEMIKYWTNFAKTGNPNKPKPVHTHWPQYHTGTEDFLELNFKNGQLDFSVKTNLRQKYVRFWTDVILKIVERKNSLAGRNEHKHYEKSGKDEL